MRKITLCIAIITSLIMSISMAPAQDTRTTPVEVQNTPTVKIDGTENTVKSQQSGAWDVNITGTPTVNVGTMPNVNVNPHAVSQSGTWQVGISPADNLVQTQVKSTKSMILTSNMTIPAGGLPWLPNVNCAGYKEVRLVLYSSDLAYDKASGVSMWFCWDDVNTGSVKWYETGKTTNIITSHPSFNAMYSSFCIVMPVMGNTLSIRMLNTATGSANFTLNSNGCWAYLVN